MCPGQARQQGVGRSGIRQRDIRDTDRLAVGAIDDGTLVRAQSADAVARAEEGKITRHDLVEKRVEFRFDSLLHGGREMSGVGGVERSAADEDPGKIIEIQPGHRRGFEANPDEVALGEAGRGEKEPVLLVGGHVFGAGREEDERLHTSG